MARLRKSISNYFVNLENASPPLPLYLVLLLIIVLIRGFLETILVEGKFLGTETLLLHYPAFFISLILAISAFMSVILKKSLISILKLIISGSIIILLPPILDSIIFGRENFRLMYLYVNSFRELVRAFFTFYFSAPSLSRGVTLSIRIELALAMAGIGWFTYILSKKITKTILAVISFYVITFLFLSIPFYKNLISRLIMTVGFSETASYLGYPDFFFLLLYLEIILLLFANRKSTLNLLPIPRYSYLSGLLGPLMMLGGLLMGIKNNPSYLWQIRFVNIVLCSIMTMGGWLIINLGTGFRKVNFRFQKSSAITTVTCFGTVLLIMNSFLIGEIHLYLYLVYLGCLFFFVYGKNYLPFLKWLAGLPLGLAALASYMIGFSLCGREINEVSTVTIIAMVLFFSVIAGSSELIKTWRYRNYQGKT
ncbi:hypothetical protein JW877_03050 [bacterium]|nr:hypothetical protein [bacterium]